MKENSTPKNFVSGMESIIPTKNDTPYERILVIGDIHGKFTKLMSLWRKLSVTDRDLIIFLGDYIDRGNEVAETLKWILEQSTKKNFIFLAGNHELIMLETFYGQMNKIDWLFNGGRETIRALSELKAEDKTFIDKILDFAKDLSLYHEMTIGDRKYVFAHAGIEEGIPLDEQDREFLIWARGEFLGREKGYNGEDVVIVGHTPIQALYVEKLSDKNSVAVKLKGTVICYADEDTLSDNSRPYKVPGRNILMMDTGSFVRWGKISAVNLLNGELWQSDAE